MLIKGQLYLEWLKHRRKVSATMLIVVLLGIGLTTVSYISHFHSISDFIMMYLYGWMVVLPFLAVIPLFINLEQDLRNRHIWLYTEASLKQLLLAKVLFISLVCMGFIVIFSLTGFILELCMRGGSVLSALVLFVTLSLMTLYKIIVLQFLFLLLWAIFQAVTVLSQAAGVLVMPISYAVIVILCLNFYDVLKVGGVPIHLQGIMIGPEYEPLGLFYLDKLYMGEIFAGLFLIVISCLLSARFLQKKVGV